MEIFEFVIKPVSLYGSLAYILGLTFQILVAYKQQGFVSSAAMFLITISRLLTFAGTVLIWFHFTISSDFSLIFQISIPAIVLESIFSPLMLTLAGFNVKFAQQLFLKTK